MAQTATLSPGRPVWVDLGTHDIDGALAFYGPLFGWQAKPASEVGSYTILCREGKDVAAAGTVAGPCAWQAYIGTRDLSETVAAARKAGAEVVSEPRNVTRAGRMAVLRDPTGAQLALWEAGEHRGFEVRDQPNTFAWLELHTRDVGAAARFYESTFGWTAVHSSGDVEYTEWSLEGHHVGGAMAMSDDMVDVLPNWTVYFAVADVDSACHRVRELGGGVEVSPREFPGGRYAICTDPERARFGLLRLHH